MKNITLILTFICIITVTLCAQNPQWITYTTVNSGLASNDVQTIEMDPNGNKWFGTSKGVSKFDGANWTIYDTSNSGLAHHYVNAIAMDAAGNKWFGLGTGSLTAGGVSKFDGANWTTFNTYNSGLSGNYVVSIAAGPNNNLWFGNYQDGVSTFDGSNWTNFTSSYIGLPPNKAIHVITKAANGDMWVATSGGVSKFNGIAWTAYTTSNSGLANDHIKAVYADNSNGNVWFGTLLGGVSKFDGSGWVTYNPSNSGLISNQVYAVAIDNSSNVWLGTNIGLSKFDGFSWTTYTASNSGLVNNNIHSIKVDSNNKKWIGTSNGISVLDETGSCSAYITPTADTNTLSANGTGTAPFTFLWNTGDTTSSIYTSLGNGNYCVTVTDATGCSSSHCYYFNTFYCNSQASFTYTVNGNTVTVNNTSTGNYTSVNWFFDDGTGWIAATSNPFSHTYTQAGTYQITLGLGDGQLPYGCDSIGMDVTVGSAAGGCSASIIDSTMYNGSLTVASYYNNPSATNQSISWYLNGNFLTSYSAYGYAPTVAGNYCAIVKYYNTSNILLCEDSACFYYAPSGNDSCQASFTYTVNGNTVTVNNTSTGNYNSVNWNFGDGSGWITVPANANLFTYKYLQPGMYHITLGLGDSTGINPHQCDSTGTDVNIISGNIKIQAYGNTCTVPTTIQFQILEYVYGYTPGTDSINMYVFFYNDSAQNTVILNVPIIDSMPVDYAQAYFTNTFTTTGQYLISCTTIGPDGTQDTIFSQILITDTCYTSCQASFTYTMNNNTVTVINTSTGNYDSLYWDFGDGTGWIYAPSNTFTHAYAQPGAYHITLGLGDSSLPYGCDSTGTTIYCNCSCPSDAINIITPDGNGDRDNMYLSCSAIKIYNRFGILVKTLSGPAIWDGTDNSGILVSMGAYIVLCNENGTVTDVTVIR